MLLPIPTTVNNASPMVSNMKNVLFNRISDLPNKMTKPNANAVQTRYTGLTIQEGVVSSNTSRMVPPPIAVTNPTT